MPGGFRRIRKFLTSDASICAILGPAAERVPTSTAKKVIVRRFDREALTGYVNPFSYLQAQSIELLKPDGALVLLPYEQVKSVAFVRDFEKRTRTGARFFNPTEAGRSLGPHGFPRWGRNGWRAAQ